MAEYINQIYNREDGERVYNEIVSLYSNYFETEGEAANFVDDLLKQCLPAAAVAGIDLNALIKFTTNIVVETKRIDIFNQAEVVQFIRRILVRHAQEIYGKK